MRGFASQIARKIQPKVGHALDFAAYTVVRLFVIFVQTLPLDMGNSACRGLAYAAAFWLRIRQRTIDENLDRCFPHATSVERRELTIRMWHHLLLMVFEIAWAQRRLHLTNWSEYVRFHGNIEMLDYLLSDRPTVLVTGHFGNFEIGGYVIGLMGFDTMSIARRLDNEFFHDWVQRFREAHGQYMVDKIGCAPIVDKHLQSGGTLSLLADQHAGDRGCWVNFMGVPASCHKALALFTMISDAPMLVGYTRRLNDQPMQFESGVVAVADPRVDPTGVCQSVDSLTQWYNEHLAAIVSQSVEQYWWLHRRWRTPPPKIAQRLARFVA